MTPDVDDHIAAALWIIQAYGYNRRRALRIISEIAADRFEYIRQCRALAQPMPSKALH